MKLDLLTPSDADGPVVGVAGAHFATLADLLAAHPAIADDANLLAQATNHLGQGFAFEVIEDPAAFETAYRDQLASEDPSVPWAQGVNRLCDFGVPDFASIAAPAIADGQLSMSLRDQLTGLPYTVSIAVGDVPADTDYVPLPLSPVERPDPTPATPRRADQNLALSEDPYDRPRETHADGDNSTVQRR